MSRKGCDSNIPFDQGGLREIYPLKRRINMKKKFAKISIASLLFILAVAGLAMQSHVGSRRLSAQAIPGGTLDPT